MERILKLLKPKVVSLGFNEKELESAVKAILKNNPDLEKEDTTEEVINAALDAVIPFLGVAQQNSSRVINEFKKRQKANPSEEEEPEDKGKGSDNPSDIVKAIQDAVKTATAPIVKELEGLKSDKTRISRKAQLEQVVKDAGKYGQKILKEFEERTYKTFDNDEEFEAYLESTKQDVTDYIQEEKDRGLSSFSSFGGGKKPLSTGEPSKEEVDSIVNNLSN